MGRVKSEWMAAEERGWSVDEEKYVCRDCVDDKYLKSIIDDEVEVSECSYCENISEVLIAAPISSIMVPIADAVHSYFGNPDDVGLPWDEGEYVIPPTETVDVLDSLPLFCQEDLFQDVCNAFTNNFWIRASGGSWLSMHQSEDMISSWMQFSYIVMHRTRFYFSHDRHRNDTPINEYNPIDILDEIGEVAKNFGLFSKIPAGFSLFRSRLMKNYDDFEAIKENMGPPPSEKAAAGRMNPAGIRYLYTAFDKATAIAETFSGLPEAMAMGKFSTLRELQVLDLSKLPEIPSIFDGEGRSAREALLFFDNFVSAISKPVKKDGSEHINYIPSQVVCEYFAQIYRADGADWSVDGIIYPSAILPNGRNLVLFPDEALFGDDFGFVRLEGTFPIELGNWNDVSRELGGHAFTTEK